MNKLAPPHSSDRLIESRSLSIGKWANLVMGISGVMAAWLSRSDALLVDGLFSAVNFLSAIVAAQVGLSISRLPDSKRPFGYDADEALYVTFRSMTLAGIIAFAAFTAVEKIMVFLAGGFVPELRFDIIVIYTIAMVGICGGLAVWHHHNWNKTGQRSEILHTEARAAFVDGIMSAGTGIALSIVPFLKGTALAGIIPIADAIVVLFLAAFIIRQPVTQFIVAIGELAGASASQRHYKRAHDTARKFADTVGFKLVDLAITKLGRSFFLVAYLDPKRPVAAEEIDALRAQLHDEGRALFGNLQTEIIITGTSRTKR